MSLGAEHMTILSNMRGLFEPEALRASRGNETVLKLLHSADVYRTLIADTYMYSRGHSMPVYHLPDRQLIRGRKPEKY